jgi:hypothetical protein
MLIPGLVPDVRADDTDESESSIAVLESSSTYRPTWYGREDWSYD